MPRDGSGNYTLPGGINPVISGTTIDIAWANPTLGDVATALTDSLSRTGSGGMLVPFLNADGAIGTPGIAWVNEPSMGIYRPNANEMRFVTAGVDQFRSIVNPDNPVQVWVDTDSTWRTLLNIFNPYTIIGDWTWQGRLVTDDATTARAGFNIPTGVEPTVPVEGDMWKTGTQLFIFLNGVVQGLGNTTLVQLGAIDGESLRWDDTGGVWEPIDSIIFSESPPRVEVSRVARFETNVQFHTAGLSDYMWFTGFNTIFSIVGVGIVDQLTFSGWDFLELDGPTLKIFELAVPAGDELQYGQIWVQNTNPRPRLMYTDDLGNDGVVAIAGGKNQANVRINVSIDFNDNDEFADNLIAHYFDGGNDTLTLEDDSSVVQWPVFSTIQIIAPGSGVLTVVEGISTTLFLADGSDTVGGVTVTQGVCSITRQTADNYIIYGSGITP